MNIHCHPLRDFRPAPRSLPRVLAGCVLAALTATQPVARAAAPRALDSGKLPEDRRLGPLRDLDSYFPFQVPATPAAWQERAAVVRRDLQVSLGLWPEPTRTPLNARIHGRIGQGDYSVEKVYFESMPGFFVAGNLYRPLGQAGKRPVVLCPHGHWDNGRFTDDPAIRQKLADGAERFENGGRSPLQARCVQLARMGCVVFHYDMIGYADTVQIPMEIAHTFGKQRPAMNRASGWGLYSPQAESHSQHVMGLQTWNSIRALDFVLALPEADPTRVGVTGASGGGTQTFILGALDPRPTVAFPAVMVSTAMQGGCTCENACGLRVTTGNVEIAALFAPKPLGMTGANDWTREMDTKGFPELQRLYTLLGAKPNVMLKHLPHFGHNYNHVSRAAMYSWFNKHFQLGFDEPVLERDYPRLDRDQLTVWTKDHPQPAGGPEFETRLLQGWHDDAQRQLAEQTRSTEGIRRTLRPAIEATLGRTLATAGKTEWRLTHKEDRGRYLEMTGLIRNTTHNEELPALFLHPTAWNQETVIVLSPRGKADLTRPDGSPTPEVQALLDAGSSVASIDLLYQGEFLADNKPIEKTRKVANPREFAGYTFGYNPSLFAQRVHDVLTLVAFIRNNERVSKRICIVAPEGAGPWAAAALAVSGDAVNDAALDTGGFRFGNVTDYLAPEFLPGGAKYLDLPGMLGLAAPTRLRIRGETATTAAFAAQAYQTAGQRDRLEFVSATPDLWQSARPRSAP